MPGFRARCKDITGPAAGPKNPFYNRPRRRPSARPIGGEWSRKRAVAASFVRARAVTLLCLRCLARRRGRGCDSANNTGRNVRSMDSYLPLAAVSLDVFVLLGLGHGGPAFLSGVFRFGPAGFC